MKQKLLNLDDPKPDARTEEFVSGPEFLRLCDLEKRGLITITNMEVSRRSPARLAKQLEAVA